MNATTQNTAVLNDSYDDNQSKVKDTIVNIFTAIKLWHENVKGRRELAKLNDHFLRDAGLTRLEVSTLANSFYLVEPIHQDISKYARR